MERLDVSDGFKLFVSRLNCYTHTPNPNDVGIHVGTQGEVRGRILDLGFGWDNSTGPYTNKGKDLDHSYYSEYVFMHKVVKCIVDGKYTIINDRPYSQKGLISLMSEIPPSRVLWTF